MKWIGKLTGGLLGAVALGPMGAALGVLLGHQFDEHAEELQARWSGSGDAAAIGERFFRATFRVMGYLAKADGRVSEQEIGAARAVMDELHLDGAQVREAIACFTAGKQPDFDPGGELAALRGAAAGGRICCGCSSRSRCAPRSRATTWKARCGRSWGGSPPPSASRRWSSCTSRRW